MKRITQSQAVEGDRVAVLFDTPGVQSIGPYAAGIVHTVSGVEAQRLIAHKSFRLADPTPMPPQGGES